jgi:outer membrane biogenesis lipoprotein LolB
MRIAFGALALATFLLAACSGPQGHRVKQERRAKKETQDRLDRWDQKAIRVRRAQ